MGTVEQRVMRARSNVKAAFMRIGMVGVLELIATQCVNSACATAKNPGAAEHYAALANIITKASKEFRDECLRFDNTYMESKS